MENKQLIKLLVIDEGNNSPELEELSNQTRGPLYVDVRKVSEDAQVNYLYDSWRPSALVVNSASPNVEKIVAEYGAYAMVIVTAEKLDYEYAGAMIAKGASAVIKNPNNKESFTFLIENIKDLNPTYSSIQ